VTGEHQDLNEMHCKLCSSKVLFSFHQKKILGRSLRKAELIIGECMHACPRLVLETAGNLVNAMATFHDRVDYAFSSVTVSIVDCARAEVMA